MNQNRAADSSADGGTVVGARGCSREEFLRRIRLALVGPDSAASLLPKETGRKGSLARAPFDLSLVRLVARGADRTDLFVERATAGGLRVRRVSPNDLVARVAETLNLCGARRAAISVPGPTGRSLRDSLASRGVAIVGFGAGGSLDAQYDADAGITDCDAALAESGTIVLRSDAQRSRGTFIVPPVHVVILRASQILPDMLDYWPTLGARGESVEGGGGSAPSVTRELERIPTSVVMVSGPSKTADIEGILITGVHGPREVHVLLVDDR